MRQSRGLPAKAGGAGRLVGVERERACGSGGTRYEKRSQQRMKGTHSSEKNNKTCALHQRRQSVVPLSEVREAENSHMRILRKIDFSLIT